MIQSIADQHRHARRMAKAWVLARFVLVGLLCAIAYSALSRLLIDQAHLPVFAAGGLSYITVTPVSYLLHRGFTFRVRSAHRESWPRYLTVSGLATVLSSVIPTWLSSPRGLALDINSALALTCIFVPMASYLAKSSWVFAHQENNAG